MEQPERIDPGLDPVHDEVGGRIRAAREEAGLSLRALARSVGVSPSAVSQIETGKSRPSVSTLYAIVTALGISLDELFGTDAAAEPPVPRPVAPASAAGSAAPASSARSPVQRAQTRHSIDLESGVRWERLTAHADPEVDFLYVVYDVGGASSVDEKLIRHSGREYGLVLSGTLEVTVGFDTYVLGPGDSVSFDSTIPHRLRNVGTDPVHGIWCVLGRRDSDVRTLGQAAGGDVA